MAFRVRIDSIAQRQIDEFAEYLRRYDEHTAIEQAWPGFRFAPSGHLDIRLADAISPSEPEMSR